MDFVGFQWGRGNTLKCGKHGVSRAEIESLFSRPALIVVGWGQLRIGSAFSRDRRHRFETPCVRVLTLRGGFVRPISARYMHAKEIRRYEKDNPDLQER